MCEKTLIEEQQKEIQVVIPFEKKEQEKESNKFSVRFFFC